MRHSSVNKKEARRHELTDHDECGLACPLADRHDFGGNNAASLGAAVQTKLFEGYDKAIPAVGRCDSHIFV